MVRRRLRGFLWWIAAVLLGPPLIYTLAAFGFSLLATPRLQPRDGIEIYVCDNGVHADLVLPVAAAGTDWRAVFAAEFFTGAIDRFDHVGIGWGSRDFYLETPTWAEFSPRLAVKALLWDETVLHVDYRPRPLAGEDCRQWRVDDDAYRRLAAFVRAGLALQAGRPGAVGAGYGPGDAFFAANGRYSIIDTCNQWTALAMRSAGAPVAPWAPFSFLVLWHLPPIAP